MPDEDDDALNAAFGVITQGQALGRYELLAPIGRGGMALVWAARVSGTRGSSELFAVKTMLPALSTDPRFARMFLAEAELAAQIIHPNVCEVVEAGEANGLYYLAMEWIDGEPLSRLGSICRTAAREIPPGVATHLLAQSARGLQAAHALEDENGELAGVVHRDVSPQNILVTRAGVAKVVDFGVARVATRRDHATDTGFIKGKVAYLAPEQIEQVAVDGRADVFALGVVLFELLTAEHPFRAATELSTLLAIASGDPAPALPSSFPAELRTIVARSLEKDGARRYPTMAEFAEALEDFSARCGCGIDDVAAFVRASLGDRRERVARDLRDAARAADARAVTSLASPAASTKPSSTSVPSPRRSKRAATFASFAIVALAAGAAGALLSRESGRASAGPRIVFSAASGTTPGIAAAAGTIATATPAVSPSPMTPAVATPPTPTPRKATSLPGPDLPRRPARHAPSAAPVSTTSRTNPLDGWD